MPRSAPQTSATPTAPTPSVPTPSVPESQGLASSVPAPHVAPQAKRPGTDTALSPETVAAIETAERVLAGVEAQPRPYQLRITGKAMRQFAGEALGPDGQPERPAHAVMIESPTGSGKTIMGLTIARYLQQRYGYSIGWVAMRRNLLAQAEEENRRRGFGVTMTTISMFDKAPPAVDVLIVDEAQHDAAMSMANIHCAVEPKHVLGLTATPFRSDRIRLCFDKVIRDAGIQSLIQDGYLSSYHHYTIPDWSPETVARFFLAEPERWGKSLIFFHKQADCRTCEQILQTQGVRCEVVTAQTDRMRQLEDFEQGRLDVLINMAILTEGFDCPELKTVFCRPSGKGPTVQMAGRVLRRHADHPYKQIVQCASTRHPMTKTAWADEQYLWSEQSWRMLKINKKIEAVCRKMQTLLFQSSPTLPDSVARHRTPARIPSPWRRDA